MDGLLPFQNISVAILAGGLGTRLRSVVGDRPKVLAPVLGRPFLMYLLDQLSEAGVRKVLLLAGFGGEQLQATFGDHYSGMALEYSMESKPLGTAGAVRYALPLLEEETILLLNGDSYCDFDLERFCRFHRERSHKASMVLTQVDNASRFGKVHLGNDDSITGFEEKESEFRPWVDQRRDLLVRPQLGRNNSTRPVYVAGTRYFADLGCQ